MSRRSCPPAAGDPISSTGPVERCQEGRPTSRCAGEGIRDDDVRRALGTLLQEGTLWLAIQWRDPPPDCRVQTLLHHERALGELREVFAERGLDAHTYTAALSWLTGYCMSMRARHDGASASDVLGRGRDRDPAERADRRAPAA